MLRLPRPDIGRWLAVASLVGKKRTELFTAAKAYASTALRERANRAVLERISKGASNGAKIVLVTASLDPIAEAFRNALGYHAAISSTLLYAAGYCTGLLRDDLLGRKWNAVQRRIGTDVAGQFALFTDNNSDVDLISKAGHTIFIGDQIHPRTLSAAKSKIEFMPR